MNKRYLGAVVLSPLLIILLLGGMYLRYGLLILSLLGMYEFYSVSKMKKINPMSYVGYISCIFYYFSLDRINFKVAALVFIFLIFLMLCIPTICIKYNFLDIAVTALGIIYVAVFFSFITLINVKEYGRYLIWIIFLSSWLCDTMAYYSGRFFGKHKLCPKVSPKKTIEGSIGGLFGSVLGCVILGLIAINYGVKIELYHFVILGTLCGVFCQFGDLAASSIKRHVGVKDYSNLIPGHGGILDRFDSILFAAVIVYYYLTFIIQI